VTIVKFYKFLTKLHFVNIENKSGIETHLASIKSNLKTDLVDINSICLLNIQFWSSLKLFFSLQSIKDWSKRRQKRLRKLENGKKLESGINGTKQGRRLGGFGGGYRYIDAREPQTKAERRGLDRTHWRENNIKF
jgi:hypothetical protein